MACIPTLRHLDAGFMMISQRPSDKTGALARSPSRQDGREIWLSWFGLRDPWIHGIPTSQQKQQICDEVGMLFDRSIPCDPIRVIKKCGNDYAD
jgi:hypothetical protein